MSNLRYTVFFLLLLFGCQMEEEPQLPNILFCIADDQSWLHTSYKRAELNTPGFDYVVKKGLVFERAYCAASSCAPSRAAILTGQQIYNLEEGGLLFGGLPKEIPLFTDLIEAQGYQIAHTGKAYGPANTTDEAYHQAPLGQAYNQLTRDAPQGVSKIDYVANFKQFLTENKGKQPFFFWYGGMEPHRAYDPGIGLRSGRTKSNITVPKGMPDTDEVRSDIADYFSEIEWFDFHLVRMIESLGKAGELDNTIIIVTADNGMPFPGGKTTGYELGTHVPFAICWGKKIKPGKILDYIGLVDVAPTILDILDLPIPAQMNGRSFKEQLFSTTNGQIDSTRNTMVTALERHTYCRPDGLPYPIRTFHKDEWVLIHNFEPDRVPAGNSDFQSAHQGIYGDIDAGPTRTYMIDHQNDPEVKPLFDRYFGKHPEFELYNLYVDPDQQTNLAYVEEHLARREAMNAELNAYLTKTNDPRMQGESPWDNMPYYHPAYEGRHLKPIGQRDTLEGGFFK